MYNSLKHLTGEQPLEEVVLPASTEEPELGVRAVLRTYPLVIPTELLESSRAELDVARDHGTDSFNPNFEEDLTRFPRAMELSRFLAEHLFDADAGLSFIRSMREQTAVFIGNLHHDWKYVGYNEEANESGSIFRPSNDVEIWRQILNLGPTPRYLQIVDAPLLTFADKGIDTDTIRPNGFAVEGNLTIDNVAKDVIAPPVLEGNSRIFPIPAYDGERLAVFEFWASRILHAGITEEDGHFMAAAATWKPIGSSTNAEN